MYTPPRVDTTPLDSSGLHTSAVGPIPASQHIGEAKEWALNGDPELRDRTYINGYDDVEIIAGTGTLGVEMLEQVP